jgi:quinoprotein glucose dehydrogenase
MASDAGQFQVIPTNSDPKNVKTILNMRVFPVNPFQHVASISTMPFVKFALMFGVVLAVTAAEPYNPYVAPASDEAQSAMKRFRVPKGFKVELFAAEPLLANPVAFHIDEKGRFFVAETFRLHTGVTDIRGHMNWLNDDLASKSVADRVAMMRKYEGARISKYGTESDRLRLVMDSDGDGRADKSTVFSQGYNEIADGLAAGVLARKGDVYFANIPHLWLLQDGNNDGIAETKKSLHYGYGVRVGFIGHDLHGLRFGPDGKLYFSIGDRGASIKTKQGDVENPETGAVYRCNPDGSDLEIFAYGLRNPQELAFDQYGNLFTGENNSDGGDPARWVHLVEGGDSGWRIGFQFIERPNLRGAWMSERMCYPDSEVAYALPPLANIGNGPSGLTYYPGIGFPAAYNEHFFMCDFRGGTGSGIYSFACKPKGASFEVVDRAEFVWEVLVTDCDFGYDGSLYLSDWVNGWNKTGKGRIYRVSDPTRSQAPLVAETKKLMAEGFTQRPTTELAGLLTHPDQRIRQESQFELASRGEASVGVFARVAAQNENLIPRLHGIWGLGQLARSKQAVPALVPLLQDRDPEVRAQAARVLGDVKAQKAAAPLIALLADAKERPRFFAAIALGKLRKKEAFIPLVRVLQVNNNKDKYLRHAAVMGLAGCADPKALRELAHDSSAAVRMGAVLALRRMEHADVAAFLDDADPAVAAEAARAINDLPITGALPQLALKLDRSTNAPFLRRAVNANYRIGAAANAEALVAFAGKNPISDNLRVEALDLLGAWANPSGRDAITGLWRPLPKRDRLTPGAALQPKLAELLKSPSHAVKAASIRAAGQLDLKSATPKAAALVRDTALPGFVRVEALKSLANLKASMADTLEFAMADRDEALRKEASRLQAQLQPKDATTNLKTILERGTIGEKQAAFATLAALTNSPASDQIIEGWLDKVIAEEIPEELWLDVLEAANKRTAPSIRDKIRKFEDARPADDNLRSFRECLVGGDAAEGKRIFFEKAEVYCLRCHKVNGEGGEVGPDLTGIGAKQSREYLVESIALPNKQIAPGFDSTIVTMKSGATYAGVVKSETAEAIEINSPEDGLVKLKKADIQTRERGPSAMPEELRQILTKQEMRHLVEYLATLK